MGLTEAEYAALSDAEREELRRRVEEKFRSAVLKNLSGLPAYIEFLEKKTYVVYTDLAWDCLQGTVLSVSKKSFGTFSSLN